MEVKDTNVEEGKRLRSLGCYVEAVAIFSRAAESPTSRLEVIIELGETLLLQGYYNRALEILNKALCDAKATEDTFLPPAQLLRCCIAAVVTAKLKKCVEDAEQVYNGLGKVDFSGVPNHCKVSRLNFSTSNRSYERFAD
jgi:tetratricopeptide (TPR) repeat protein